AYHVIGSALEPSDGGRPIELCQFECGMTGARGAARADGGFKDAGSRGVGSRVVGSRGVGSQALGSQALGSQALGSQALGSQALGSQALGSRAAMMVGRPRGAVAGAR